MSRQIKWTWSWNPGHPFRRSDPKDGRWIQVANQSSRSRLGDQWLPVSRFDGEDSYYPEKGLFFDAEPDWTPDLVGVKLEIHVDRQVEVFKSQQEEVQHRASFQDRSHDIDFEDFWYGEGKIVNKWTVTAIQGHEPEQTHLCGYCEEYSAADPGEHDICKGCGAHRWLHWDTEVEKHSLRSDLAVGYTETHERKLRG